MSSQLAALRTDLPPPMRHLLHDERPVGWLTGNRIGFFGFADADEAAHAAWVAYRTVSRKLAPIRGERPVPIDVEPLRIEWHNGRELIVAGARRVAELVRPNRASPTGSLWFGFIIEVLPEIDDSTMRDAMRTASRALLKSGVPWSMVRPRRRLPRQSHERTSRRYWETGAGVGHLAPAARGDRVGVDRRQHAGSRIDVQRPLRRRGEENGSWNG